MIGKTGAGKTTFIQTLLGYTHKTEFNLETNLWTFTTTRPLDEKHKYLVAKKGAVSVTSEINLAKLGDTPEMKQMLEKAGIK